MTVGLTVATLSVVSAILWHAFVKRFWLAVAGSVAVVVLPVTAFFVPYIFHRFDFIMLVGIAFVPALVIGAAWRLGRAKINSGRGDGGAV